MLNAVQLFIYLFIEICLFAFSTQTKMVIYVHLKITVHARPNLLWESINTPILIECASYRARKVVRGGDAMKLLLSDLYAEKKIKQGHRIDFLIFLELLMILSIYNILWNLFQQKKNEDCWFSRSHIMSQMYIYFTSRVYVTYQKNLI